MQQETAHAIAHDAGFSDIDIIAGLEVVNTPAIVEGGLAMMSLSLEKR